MLLRHLRVVFSGQAGHGTDNRTFPMLGIGEKSDAVNRPRLTFSVRPKTMSFGMLQFGGVFRARVGRSGVAAPTGQWLTSTRNHSSVISQETNASSNNQRDIPCASHTRNCRPQRCGPLSKNLSRATARIILRSSGASRRFCVNSTLTVSSYISTTKPRQATSCQWTNVENPPEHQLKLMKKHLSSARRVVKALLVREWEGGDKANLEERIKEIK